MEQEGLRLYQWAEELKIQLKRKSIFKDSQCLVVHHKLLAAYKRLLTRHLSYSLEKKVENDLWNIGFKEWITRLQKDKSTVLDWFLDFALGFYDRLLEEISSENKYINQHILVHLGDISRYKNQREQAMTFYRRAMRDFPDFGQSYNQIGLMSPAEDLKAVFYYVRAVSVKHEFPSARANLSKMFGKVSEKKSAESFSDKVLQFHGLVHHARSLKKAVKILKDLRVETMDLLSHVHVAAITIFHLENFKGQEKLRIVVLELFSLLLDGFLNDSKGLAAVKLMLDWIIRNPYVVEEPGFDRRQVIWPGLCKLLNEIQKLNSIDCQTPSLVFLPEDAELAGFDLAAVEAGEDFGSIKRPANFSECHEYISGLPPLVRGSRGCSPFDESLANLVRRARISQCGKSLVEKQILGISESSDFRPLQVQLDTIVNEDILDKLAEKFSDDEEDVELKEITNNVKPPIRKNRNAALSAILKMKTDKPKVSFKIAEEEGEGRFLGLNGPPQLRQHMKLASEILRQDFSVPPPRLPSSSGLGRIGPASIPSQLAYPSLPSGGVHFASVRPPPPPLPNPGRESGYSLFSGQGMWPSGGPPLPSRAPENHHILFQPGPSPLERLLQENNLKHPRD